MHSKFLTRWINKPHIAGGGGGGEVQAVSPGEGGKGVMVVLFCKKFP